MCHGELISPTGILLYSQTLFGFYCSVSINTKLRTVINSSSVFEDVIKSNVSSFMSSAKSERSVDTFYHGWFHDGSAKWDSVIDSLYGPAAGFLVGGPNPFYTWDVATCVAGNNANICGDAVLSPPAGQPDQKAYLQFNDSWPLNSWEVTEKSNGYPTAYIRLLAQFVSGN